MVEVVVRIELVEANTDPSAAVKQYLLLARKPGGYRARPPDSRHRAARSDFRTIDPARGLLSDDPVQLGDKLGAEHEAVNNRLARGYGLAMKVVECPALSEATVTEAIRQVVHGYKREFGDRLAQVWLFGSRARGDHRSDADVDLLVVLHTEAGRLADLDLMLSVDAPLRQALGVFIDPHPTTLRELETSDDDFHYFVRREGRRVDV